MSAHSLCQEFLCRLPACVLRIGKRTHGARNSSTRGKTLDIVDRAYILHDGMVLMEGEPSEIVAHKEVRRVYLGERFSL